jgi:hypothetical protein
VDDKKIKIETDGESLHNKIKDLHENNCKKAEIPLWIELSHKFRREKVETSLEPFINLYNDFSYLSDHI